MIADAAWCSLGDGNGHGEESKLALRFAKVCLRPCMCLYKWSDKRPGVVMLDVKAMDLSSLSSGPLPQQKSGWCSYACWHISTLFPTLTCGEGW